MPSKIRVLSDHTINKIAAGEVIENPASVVKELVENSLDAGATDISIEIQGGGRQMIRISDNGCGMNADDALLCLERHATSKLREVEDIHSLLTMGFRGEAIPSIASISKFNLLTCAAEEANTVSNGTMVIVDGGKMVSCHPAARSQGTTIEVKSLFFNVPVRKKFLKSPAIDTNEILKIISLIALGHPEMKFQLISDGKNLLSVPACGGHSFVEQLKERIEHVLGLEFYQNTTFIEEKNGAIRLEGVIGTPSFNRHNRTGQYLFVNRRPVVSPLIAYAVKEGFGSSIAAGRFPVFVLHVFVTGDLVDVNVHPQKREVRLRQEQSLKELIIQAVRSAISQGHIPFTFSEQVNPISPVFKEAFESKDIAQDQTIPETWIFQTKIPPTQLVPKPTFLDLAERPIMNRATPPIAFFEERLNKTNLKDNSELSFPFSASHDSPLKILATIPGYILIDGSSGHSFIKKGCRESEKGGVILVDQKSAHLRILFEKLSHIQSSQPIAQQTLLIPYTIEVSSYESEVLRGAISLLNKMGIQIQEFGSNTFLIDSIPQMFGKTNLDILIGDIIHGLRSHVGDQMNEQTLLKEKAKRIAQAAIRAAISVQKHLSILEAEALLDQLINCQEPYFCPSGKPILAQITVDELAKLFCR